MNDDNPVSIYSVSGFSKTGKTTLIVQLIEALKAKGFSLATIKDCDKNFSLDSENKDTWKHKEAGAELAVLNSKIESSILFRDVKDLNELIKVVKTAVSPDFILVEGFKGSDLPKIWIAGEGAPDLDEDIENIILEYTGEFEELLDLILTKHELDRIVSELPGLDCKKCGLPTCVALASNIMDGKKSIDDCKELSDNYTIKMKSAGEVVRLNKFASNIIAGALEGIASELKELKDPSELEIQLARRKKDPS